MGRLGASLGSTLVLLLHFSHKYFTNTYLNTSHG